MLCTDPLRSNIRATRVGVPIRLVLAVIAAAVTLAFAAAPVSAHPSARSDAVIAWNANAGEAAVAACISPADDPLHESRMYAMTHVAIHDALNAIDRRSRPYAFDVDGQRGRLPRRRSRGRARRAGRAPRIKSPRPSRPRAVCGQSPGGGLLRRAVARSDSGRARQGGGLGRGSGGGRTDPRAPGRRRIGHAAARFCLPAGHESRRIPLHPREAPLPSPPVGRRSRHSG